MGFPPYGCSPSGKAIDVPASQEQEQQQQPQAQHLHREEEKETKQHHPGQQRDEQEMTQQPPCILTEESAPCTLRTLSFPYGVRCAIYSFLLVCSFVGLIFAIIALGIHDNMRITESFTNFTFFSRRMEVLTIFYGAYLKQYYPFADSADVALQPNFTQYDSMTYIEPPAGVRAACVCSIIVCACSGLLIIFSSVLLGLFGCQLRRGVRRQRAKDAKARQALAIVCLIFSVVCLAMSIVGLAGNITAVNGIKKAGDRALAMYNDTITSITYSKPLDSANVWPHIPNIVLFFITTVLLCVPYLSGIADRLAPEEEEEEEEESVAAPMDEEMQRTGPCHAQ